MSHEYEEMQVEKWVNLEDVAEHLSISQDTVRTWIKEGKLPVYRAGKRYKFKISEVDEWVREGIFEAEERMVNCMQRKVPSAITNITLDRATFTDVPIDELTFINFFYGNNGAGKSSIAHAIEEDDGIVWADGKTADDFDVLVYNQDFINDNFVNYGDLKGVFIFGEEDIEAKKKIADLTEQKKQKSEARQAALDT